MPSLKQPALLRDKAMAVLDAFSYEFCRKCHTERSLDKLHQGIAFIKTKIGPYMSQKLAVMFHNTLLRKCSSLGNLPGLPSTRFLRIVLEVAMDEKIIGLICTSDILASLCPENVHRIHGFSELCLHKLVEPYSLRKLHLGNLTTFKYQKFCTDLDLVIIGHDCPKLAYIDVSESRKVTNAGLCALGLCSNLRSVSVSYCSRVSVAGLKNLLTVNVRISEVFGWNNSDDTGFDYFQDPDWALDISVYPSIESFTLDLDEIRDCHLHFFVAKFPNLTSLTLEGKITEDVRILKSLSRLSQIEVNPTNRRTYPQIEPLLKCIGSQITKLAVGIAQRELSSIFNLCKNLEVLYTSIPAEFDPSVKLVMPPFPGLKEIVLVSYQEEETQTLKFGQLLKLKSLEIIGIPMRASQLESMILDHTNYPSLKRIEVTDISDRKDVIDRLKKLAKKNNLDFKLDNVDRLI